MARRNIVERYIRADIEKRVEIILDNYGMFNRILDGDWYAATKGADDLNKHRLEIETSSIGRATGC